MASFIPSGTMGRISAVLGVVGLIFCLMFSTMLFEQVDADEIVVIQSVTGNLTAHTTPGPKVQLFGTVTSYPKRDTYTFTADTRFNDGGAGVIRGSMDWIMPLGHEQLLYLHEQYGSSEAVAQSLVAVTTDKAIYMTGPLMSSTESYASRRTDLIRYIEDQIGGGIYQTTVSNIRQTNPLTGEEETVTVASIRTNEAGIELRQEDAYLASFGINTANFAVAGIDYDQRVQQQIDQQQANIMSVQTSQSEARQAEQQRITAEQRGLAAAAEARAEREVEQARQTTDAQTALQVAQLARQQAEEYRQQQILIGQGDAERRRLEMQADGALEQKLAAWLAAQEFWANAFANYDGAIVPSIVTSGGEGTVTGNGAVDFMQIMGINAARELELSLRPGG